MKNLSFLFAFIFLLSTQLIAQVPPNAFNYSAVARNAAGQPIASTTIGIQISILKTSPTGASQYSENHFVNTDAYGLFNIVIGAGAVQSGSIATIDWSNDNYYLNVGMDISGGTNFLTIGTSQFLSVPYALFSSNSNSASNGVPAGGTSGQVLTNCSGIPIWTNAGQCPGLITALNCNSSTITGSLIQGVLASGVNCLIPYTGGNGGPHPGQIAGSTGVTGLTATLSSGNFTNGTGNLNYIISGTPSNSGTAIFLLNIGGNTCNLQINVSAGFSVGMPYGGGIVGYIYQPGDLGYIAGEAHGIIVASSDLSTGTTWGCETTFIGGTSSSIGTGLSNTSTVVSNCNSTGYAARICYDLVLNGFSDWYLPSISELEKLYINRQPINTTAVSNGGSSFSLSDYWSSTEVNCCNSSFFNFSQSTPQSFTKSTLMYVRAVRSF